MSQHTFKLTLALALTFTAISIAAQDKETDKLLIQITIGNQLNEYPTLEAYKASGTTESVRNKTLRPKPETDNDNMFVIYGVDFNSDEFKAGDFIFPEEVAQQTCPDKDFDGFTMPILGAVATFRKSTVDWLVPHAKCYIIDGKEVSRKDFEALHDWEIQCVTIHGDTIMVKKRFLVEEGIENADRLKAFDDEGHLLRLRYADEIMKGLNQ